MKKEGFDWPRGKNTLDNTADLSGERPNQFLGSSKNLHKISKLKTCFWFSNSRDFKCPPFLKWKKNLVAPGFKKENIILYAFCQQLINISADRLSKKNMFFSLYQLFTSLLYTIAGERVNSEEGGGSCPYYYMFFFFSHPVLLTDIRHGKTSFSSSRK